MISSPSFAAGLIRRAGVLLLVGLVLLAGSCANMSKPKLGITGSHADPRHPGDWPESRP